MSKKDRSQLSKQLAEELANNPTLAHRRTTDDTRRLTLWKCRRCLIWAVTPDALRQPPVWVGKVEQ